MNSPIESKTWDALHALAKIELGEAALDMVQAHDSWAASHAAVKQTRQRLEETTRQYAELVMPSAPLNPALMSLVGRRTHQLTGELRLQSQQLEQAHQALDEKRALVQSGQLRVDQFHLRVMRAKHDEAELREHAADLERQDRFASQWVISEVLE